LTVFLLILVCIFHNGMLQPKVDFPLLVVEGAE